MKRDIEGLLIDGDSTALQAMKLIDGNAKGILFVVNHDNKLLGTISDGDIRRFLISGNSINSVIKEIYNKNCIYLSGEQDLSYVKHMLLRKRINIIPVVDAEGTVIGYYDMETVLNEVAAIRSNPVLIMAGGLGTRLRPLTEDTPKPMLRIGGKPLLEIIICQFKKLGFYNFLISVNYKAEVIENYFKDGRSLGVNIRYIRESKRMGTAGAIKLAESYLTEPFFVVNGDILTNIDFESFLKYHLDNEYSLTIGTRSYEIEIPYGVIEKDADSVRVTALKEKPKYDYLVSGGMYVLNEEIVKLIPEDKYYDITELIENLIDKGYRIGSFPITEYWLDIGRIDDYKKANNDVYKYF